MSTPVDVCAVACMLEKGDRIWILTHMKPDGDTFGSGFALLRALHTMGKSARILCADGFPDRYDLLYEGLCPTTQEEFEPELIVAVDISSPQLFGEKYAELSDRIDLCIDHHPSNTGYAAALLLDADAAATGELMAQVLDEMGVPISADIATALYTAIASDTGCFRYANTRSDTLRLAARLMDAGADGYRVARQMFELKSRGRLEVERLVMQTLEYRLDGRIAMLTVTMDDQRRGGVSEVDLEGISAIPRQIEGVEIGITLKERFDGSFRVSMRCSPRYNASDICATLGGGGHPRAAGCMLNVSRAEAAEMILGAAERAVLGA